MEYEIELSGRGRSSYWTVRSAGGISIGDDVADGVAPGESTAHKCAQAVIDALNSKPAAECGEKKGGYRLSPCVLNAGHGGADHRDRFGCRWPAQPPAPTDSDRAAARNVLATVLGYYRPPVTARACEEDRLAALADDVEVIAQLIAGWRVVVHDDS